MFSSRFSVWVMGFVVALCAGMVGGVLLLLWYVVPRFQAFDQALSARLDQVERVDPKPAVEVVRVEREPAAPVIPSIFLQGRRSPVLPLVKRSPRVNGENILTTDRQLGSLTALTVDGWLLGSARLFEQGKVADMGVVWEGRVYPFLKVVRDTASGLVYAKVNLQNLPVAGFARVEGVVTGLPVWVESQPGRMFPYTIVDVRERAFHGSVPSEQLTRRYVLSGGSIVPDGGAVWDTSGQLVGLIESDVMPPRVIPAVFVAASLSSLSASNEIRRATLGVNGFEASLLLADVEQSKNFSQGFFIRGERSRGIAAVEAKGPSATVLKEGDILQRLDQDLLDTTADLAYRLAQYRPGTRLTVFGERAGAPFQASVVLGSVVTSEVLK